MAPLHWLSTSLLSPFPGGANSPGLILIVFEDKTPDHISDDPEMKPKFKVNKKKFRSASSSNRNFNRPVNISKSTIEELETSNEELKSTNEELQSVNEELQSSPMKSWKRLRKNLQSTNEELSTVNSELQNKVDELSKSSSDMNNLLAATEIASIFLDTALRIKRFTPATAEVIKLIQTDIGRSIGDLKTSFPEVDLAEQAKTVLKDLNTISTETLSDTGIWFAIKMMPYRSIENVIEGVVMTFNNIQEVKKANLTRRLAVVQEDANDAIVVLDLKGQITAWNKGAEAMYGYNESDALQMNFSALLPKNRAGEIKEIAARLRKGEIIKSFKSRRRTKVGKLLDIWMTATVLYDDAGHPVEMALTERDLAWLPKK